MKCACFDGGLMHAADEAVLYVWDRWGHPRIDQLRYLLIVWAASYLASQGLQNSIETFDLLLVFAQLLIFRRDERLARENPELVTAATFAMRTHPLMIAVRLGVYVLSALAISIYLRDGLLAMEGKPRVIALVGGTASLVFAVFLIGTFTVTPTGPRRRRKKTASKASIGFADAHSRS